MANEIDAFIGRRLRRRRRLMGLTQQDVAEAVGVRFQQIQKYECGANRISAARLWSLARALETPVGYFYDGLADGRDPEAEPAPAARGETRDLLRAYVQLEERPRRRLLDLARSLRADAADRPVEH